MEVDPGSEAIRRFPGEITKARTQMKMKGRACGTMPYKEDEEVGRAVQAVNLQQKKLEVPRKVPEEEQAEVGQL